MKKLVLAVLLVIALAGTPVLANAAVCHSGADSHHNHSHDDGKEKSSSVLATHHCCHTNIVFNTAHNTKAIVLDFTASKFSVTHIKLRSLYKPSPLLEPPAIA